MKYKIDTIKTVSWDSGNNVPVDEALKFFHELLAELGTSPSIHNKPELSFEIAPKETERKLNWDEAMLLHNELGEGWRLPTKDELNYMYENKTDDMLYEYSWYWSSTEPTDNSGWVLYFGTGGWFNFTKDDLNYCRLVKDLK